MGYTFYNWTESTTEQHKHNRDTYYPNVETFSKSDFCIRQKQKSYLYRIFVISLAKSEQVSMYEEIPSRLDYIKFIKITDLQDSSKVLQSNKFYFEIGECLFN